MHCLPPTPARPSHSPIEVDSIVAGARGPMPLPQQQQGAAGGLGGFFTSRSGMLSGPQCAALSGHVESRCAKFCAAHPDGDACWQYFEGNSAPVAMDFKLAITEEELDSLLGHQGAAGAVAALGAGLLPRLELDPTAASVRFILRRRAAVMVPSEVIPGSQDGASMAASAAEMPVIQSSSSRAKLEAGGAVSKAAAAAP